MGYSPLGHKRARHSLATEYPRATLLEDFDLLIILITCISILGTETDTPRDDVTRQSHLTCK